MKLARILFPLPLPEPFDYAIPDGMDARPGSYVRAPLGKIERTGVVWEVVEKKPDDERDLKPVLNVFQTPPMPEAMRKFVSFAARSTMARTWPGWATL
jgi:primosomal protein N' (replication factor Y)